MFRQENLKQLKPLKIQPGSILMALLACRWKNRADTLSSSGDLNATTVAVRLAGGLEFRLIGEAKRSELDSDRLMVNVV